MNPFEQLFCRAFQLVFRAALPLLPYREPVELSVLAAVPPLLREKGVTAVLLVADRGVRSLGLTAPLESGLTAQGISLAVYDGVVQNPTIDNVEAGRALYLSSGAQAIIAVGGGSAMDCAKAIGARIARPNKSVQRMKGLLRVLRRTPLMIAAPTTAGTGSETTLAAVIRTIVAECFPPEYVTVVEGGRAENQALLEQKFDYIFFTGGVSVGREVMRKAAEHLTPVSLELGGKSPCVVTADARIDVAAKHIAFGKLLNCGQTCVAPDYVLVDRRVKDELIAALIRHMTAMVGEDATKNPDYVHMVNEKHFDRVLRLIDPAKVVFGGRSDRATLRIQPTILDNVTAEDAVMGEEIFGPVLPILSYDDLDEAVAFIGSRPHPLALYLFSEDRGVQSRFLSAVPFGGGCINDTIIHLATSRMGFGGVGQSGMGSYHGKRSFDTFSHEKSIVKKSTLIDLPVRYAPYSRLKDGLLRVFLR